jgi:hypothetical protein
MHELVREATGVDFLPLMEAQDVEGARAAAVAAKVPRDLVAGKETVPIRILHLCHICA